jgi:ABC-type uncharacterized transport system permease subunit
MDAVFLKGLILTTLAFAAPLLLAALGELIGERAGVLNIGLEGMMLTGALAGAAASFATKNAGVGLLSAMLAGMALAALFALLAITLRADAVVVGTGLNLFALGLTGLAHRALSVRWGSYESVSMPQWFFMSVALRWFLCCGGALRVLVWACRCAPLVNIRLPPIPLVCVCAACAGCARCLTARCAAWPARFCLCLTLIRSAKT